MTRVALLVLFVVALGGGAWFVFHKSPKAMSDTNSRLLAQRRSRAILVPDVRSFALVDAKSTFDQAGLAWEVVGTVKGYHANVVVAQTPAPGTRLVDTGTPLVKLRLRASGAQTGSPQQHSAAPGTVVEVLGAKPTGVTVAATVPTTTTTAKPAPPATTRVAATQPVTKHVATTPPVKVAKPVAKPATTTAPPVAAAPSGAPGLSERPPAFILPGGAHRERVGEMPLPLRAQLLMRYMRAHKKLTKAVAHHWLVQHAWIAQGARFGWWHGAQALQTLIATDQLAERRWGVGYTNETIARQALVFVQAHGAKQ
ncbi:MAG: hypothetical protein QOH73_246 [Gaiellaceae bacterium]|nr:hypothetical protein [Gaiellaceae bacterium]